MRYGQYLVQYMTQNLKNVIVNNHSCKYNDKMTIVSISSIAIISILNLIDLEHCARIIQKPLRSPLEKNAMMDANIMMGKRRR